MPGIDYETLIEPILISCLE